MRDTAERYSNVSVLLHWLIAILIVINVVLAFMIWEAHVGFRRSIMPYHFSIGLTVLALSIVRLGWRLMHPWPPLPASMAGWEKVLSRAVHVLFYVAIVVIPLLGWLTVSANPPDRPPPAFWGIPIPRLPFAPLCGDCSTPAGLHEFHEEVGDVHKWFAYTTVGLVVLHVAGALKHTYVQKDHNLARMIPGMKTPS